MEKSPEEKLKQEKKMIAATKIWMFLTPVFALLALFNLYNWTQGSDSLSSLLSMSGMTCLGLSIIASPRNKPLSYVLLAIGIVAVFGALIMVIGKLSR